MSENRSRSAAIEFQDYLADKGLMARPTAMARKTAVAKVLSVLSEVDSQDVTGLDLDDVIRRFHNLQGKGYTPDSLNTYKSRVKSALDDFRAYLENPLSFRPNVSRREPKAKLERQPTAPQSREPSDPPTLVRSPSPVFDNASILPIPLRRDLVVRIQGLPFDLSEQEARKIAAVVMAMAAVP